ncbi:MAG: hypothetical protein SFV81_22595 [Pirellulaceae bacterium]|nr:hypothetical protein [Pirellulaceae bacterium]
MSMDSGSWVMLGLPLPVQFWFGWQFLRHGAKSLFALLSIRNSPLAKLFENRGLRWLGKISYGMYVIQLPLLTLLPPQPLAPRLPHDPI